MKKWFVVLGILLLPLAAGGNNSCCCCKSTLPATAEQNLFATSCYTGSGNDDRTVPTGILAADAGFIKICEKTAQAGNSNACAWKIPEMTGDLSCAMDNADFDPGGGFDNCGSNVIQGFFDEYVQVGTGAQVNASQRPFCYSQWTLDPDSHGTFTYTGDGTGNRTITTTAQPAMVFIQRRNASSTTNNIPWIRMEGMPANTSYPAAQFSTVSDTNHIRDFSPTGFEVGSDFNVTSATYYGAWWAENRAASFTYTGNGVSLATGTCGALGDTQSVDAGCTPVRDIWLSTSQSTGENGGTCTTLSRGNFCQQWRSVATSINATGPGNLTGTDLYAYKSSQPNNSGPGLIGDLDGDNTITVTGGANAVASCNDNGRTYYGFSTCASGPSIGTEPPPIWAFFNSVAWWSAESENAGDIAINNRNNPVSASGTSACAYPDCDLADNNTVGRSTSTVVVGTKSFDFTAASSQYLSCALSGGADNCEEFDLGGAGTDGFAVGGYVYVDSDALMTIASKGPLSGNAHWRLERQATFDRFTFMVRTAGGSNTTFNGTTNGALVGQWYHVIGQFDNNADTITVYVNANSPSTTAFADNAATGTSTSFNLGRNTANTSDFFDGFMDDMQVYDGVLGATARCKWCSCGWNGTLCQCFSEDQTVYVDTGLNATLCGSCVLPACNSTGP